MLGLDDLRARTHPAAPEVAAPTLRLETDADVPLVFALFADDEPPDAVRLIVRGEPIGTLTRDDVLDLFPISEKSSYGASGGVIVPGYASTSAYTFVALRCPIDGCPANPIFTPRFDPADPPRCDVHAEQTLELPQ